MSIHRDLGIISFVEVGAGGRRMGDTDKLLESGKEKKLRVCS